MNTRDDEANYWIFRFLEQRDLFQYKDAIAPLEKMLTYYPNDGRLLYEKMRLYEKQNMLEETIQAGEALLALAKEHKLTRIFDPPVMYEPGDKRLNERQRIAWLEGYLDLLRKTKGAEGEP